MNKSHRFSYSNLGAKREALAAGEVVTSASANDASSISSSKFAINLQGKIPEIHQQGMTSILVHDVLFNKLGKCRIDGEKS